MPRPRNPRAVRLQTRFSPQEMQELEEAAKREAVTVCEYLRQAALKRRQRASLLDRDAQREIWRQVSGAARNINQITKKVNASNLMNEDVSALRAELQQIIDSMMVVTGKKKP